MKFKRILSFILITVTILTLFAIPVAAENDPLVNTSTISSNSIVINDRITLNASGYGGTAPYTYAYYYKHTAESTWHCIKTFSEDDIALLSLHSVDTYDICIKVKDDADTVVKKYFVITVSDGPLSSSSYISTDHTFLGESIICHGVGVGGTGPYTYAMYYKRTIEDTWHCLQSFQSNCVAVLTPQYLGIYDICIKVHDSLETEHKLYFQTSVQAPPFSANAAISSEDIWLNESVYMSANAEDGNPPYLYAFYAKHNDEDNWTCLRAFSDTTYYTFTPEQAGTYELCIQVQDDNDTIMEQYFILTVHDELSADDCYISSTQITLGETITMVGRGKGGTQPYQYAFYYKRQENSDWSCAQSFGSNNVKDLTPQCATNYDICIKIKDANNTIAKKYFYNIEVEEPGFYIHYYNYDNWNNVKIYYTDGQNALVQQPGVDMTPEGDGWYSYKITNQENVEVVFNDGGNNQVPATTIQVSSDMWYRNGVQTNERPDEITVYFYKPSNWSTPNIYYYLNNNDTGPAWPGVEMEEVSDGWYVYHITKYATANVKFNDGTSQIPAQNQSGLSATDRMWYKNGVWCNETSDTDNDGLLDYQELLLGTNINLSDTDGDTLPDGYEVNMLNTDPLDTDTDDDNISDANEDADNDQLSNYAEYQSQTNPLSEDTDGDGLTDYEELHHLTHTTLSPTNPDTDGDTLNDGDEIALGWNPLLQSTYDDGILDCNREKQQTKSQTIDSAQSQVTDVSVAFTAAGNIQNTTTIKSLDNEDMIASNIEGLIGTPIEIETTSNFDEAEITFTYDETLLGETDEDDLAILWYDEENNWYHLLDQQNDLQDGDMFISTINKADRTVSVKTDHFSQYMLVDSRKWYQKWKNQLNYAHSSSVGYHFAFVVDVSLSMAGSRLSNAQQALKQFASQLTENDTRSLITFNTGASESSPISDSLTQFNQAVDALVAGGGTSVNAGLSYAVPNLNRTGSQEKIIILLCDGDVDNCSGIVNYCQTYNIKIYTINVVNANSNDLINIANLTGGQYYQAKTENDIGRIMGHINVDLDRTDTDSDGLPDILEEQGMLTVNGKIFYSSPESQDTDNDGVKDYQEIGLTETQKNNILNNTARLEDYVRINYEYIGYGEFAYCFYFEATSNPEDPDTDHDGLFDDADTAPFQKGIMFGYVGKLTIVSAPGSLLPLDFGHSFLVYESFVDDTLDLTQFYTGYDLYFSPNGKEVLPENPKGYKIHKNEIITFGVWKYKDALYENSGVSYNGEIHTIFEELRESNNQYTSEMSFISNDAYSQLITDTQLQTLLQTANNTDNYNFFVNNCSVFAERIWYAVFHENLLAHEALTNLAGPKILADYIKQKDGSYIYDIRELGRWPQNRSMQS